MIIETVKTIRLNNEETNALLFARDVLVALNDELSDDDIDGLIENLERVIYTSSWEIEGEM